MSDVVVADSTSQPAVPAGVLPLPNTFPNTLVLNFFLLLSFLVSPGQSPSPSEHGGLAENQASGTSDRVSADDVEEHISGFADFFMIHFKPGRHDVHVSHPPLSLLSRPPPVSPGSPRSLPCILWSFCLFFPHVVATRGVVGGTFDRPHPWVP